MYTYVLVLHIFVCCLLILAILIQSGKGSELGAALGGGSGDVFGPGGPANIMNKITTIIAIAFMLTSLSLAVLSTKKTSDSVTNQIQQTAPIQQQQPAQENAGE